jgi:CYTH domain-containing protein
VQRSADDAAAALAAARAADDTPREIERKYLLRGLPPEAAAVKPLRIEQGWLPGSVLRERLRRTIRPDGTFRLTRTVKFGPLGARVELEEDAPATLFDAMWPHTAAARIRKHRHVVESGAHTWEIDAFLDRDLVLAEVELAPGEPVPAPPAWLAGWIERDVTDDPAYANSSMARPDPEARRDR